MTTGIAFYAGLAALVFGLIRVTTASLEGRGRDPLGIVSIAAGLALFALCVVAFMHDPRGVLPI